MSCFGPLWLFIDLFWFSLLFCEFALVLLVSQFVLLTSCAGQLGLGDTISRNTPTRIESFEHVSNSRSSDADESKESSEKPNAHKAICGWRHSIILTGAVVLLLPRSIHTHALYLFQTLATSSGVCLLTVTALATSLAA